MGETWYDLAASIEKTLEQLCIVRVESSNIIDKTLIIFQLQKRYRWQTGDFGEMNLLVGTRILIEKKNKKAGNIVGWRQKLVIISLRPLGKAGCATLTMANDTEIGMCSFSVCD